MNTPAVLVGEILRIAGSARGGFGRRAVVTSFVCIVVAVVSSVGSIVHAGGQSAKATADHESPTRHFVQDCQVILFGELLKQVESGDGHSIGTVFERTEDAVLINGKTWVSTLEKPKEVVATRETEQAEEKGSVIEAAAAQFRTQYKKTSAGRFTAAGQTYTAAPQPFHVERYDKSVELAVKPGIMEMDYIYVTYEGTTVGMPLHPAPAPSQKEQDALRLEGAYRMALAHAQPGTIVLVTKGGSFTPYPMGQRDALLAALEKIPSLAVPVAEDIYGSMVYRAVTVDGFVFGPDVVATFVKRGRGEKR